MDKTAPSRLSLWTETSNKPYKVKMNDETVYRSNSIRDCQMFYAELKGRLFLAGAKHTKEED